MIKTYIARTRESVWRRIGDETIVMLAPESRLFTLNETATMLWDAADGATPLEEIVERTLCAACEIDFPIAYSDALSVVERLAEKGALLVSDSPFTNAA